MIITLKTDDPTIIATALAALVDDLCFRTARRAELYLLLKAVPKERIRFLLVHFY